MVRDPYRILRISPGASAAEIRTAFRQLARQYHPDINPSPRAKQHMQQLNWAYGLLRDPYKTSIYNFHQHPNHTKREPTPKPATTRSATNKTPQSSSQQPGQNQSYTYQHTGKTYSSRARTVNVPSSKRSDVLGGFIFIALLVVFGSLIGVINDNTDDTYRYRSEISVQNTDYQRDFDEKLQWASETYYQEQYYAQQEEEMRAERWDNADRWDQHDGASKYDQYSSPGDDYDPQEYLLDY